MHHFLSRTHSQAALLDLAAYDAALLNAAAGRGPLLSYLPASLLECPVELLLTLVHPTSPFADYGGAAAARGLRQHQGRRLAAVGASAATADAAAGGGAAAQPPAGVVSGGAQSLTEAAAAGALELLAPHAMQHLVAFLATNLCDSRIVHPELRESMLHCVAALMDAPVEAESFAHDVGAVAAAEAAAGGGGAVADTAAARPADAAGGGAAAATAGAVGGDHQEQQPQLQHSTDLAASVAQAARRGGSSIRAAFESNAACVARLMPSTLQCFSTAGWQGALTILLSVIRGSGFAERPPRRLLMTAGGGGGGGSAEGESSFTNSEDETGDWYFDGEGTASTMSAEEELEILAAEVAPAVAAAAAADEAAAEAEAAAAQAAEATFEAAATPQSATAAEAPDTTAQQQQLQHEVRATSGEAAAAEPMDVAETAGAATAQQEAEAAPPASNFGVRSISITSSNNAEAAAVACGSPLFQSSLASTLLSEVAGAPETGGLTSRFLNQLFEHTNWALTELVALITELHERQVPTAEAAAAVEAATPAAAAAESAAAVAAGGGAAPAAQPPVSAAGAPSPLTQQPETTTGALLPPPVSADAEAAAAAAAAVPPPPPSPPRRPPRRGRLDASAARALHRKAAALGEVSVQLLRVLEFVGSRAGGVFTGGTPACDLNLTRSVSVKQEPSALLHGNDSVSAKHMDVLLLAAVCDCCMIENGHSVIFNWSLLILLSSLLGCMMNVRMHDAIMA